MIHSVDVHVDGEDDGGDNDDDDDDELFILCEIDPTSCRHQVASMVFATTRVLAQKLKQHSVGSKYSTKCLPRNFGGSFLLFPVNILLTQSIVQCKNRSEICQFVLLNPGNSTVVPRSSAEKSRSLTEEKTVGP